MIKLLASDLDGTLVYNNEIATVDLEAVKKLKQADIKFVICTGKTYSLFKNTCKYFLRKFLFFIGIAISSNSLCMYN